MKAFITHEWTSPKYFCVGGKVRWEGFVSDDDESIIIIILISFPIIIVDLIIHLHHWTVLCQAGIYLGEKFSLTQRI